MSFRIWLLNIVMAGLLAFVGASIWDVWHMDLKEVSNPAAGGSKAGPPEAGKAEKALHDERKYELLVAQNLFSPKREEYIPPEEPEAEKEPKKKTVKISGEGVVLYGVIITGEEKTALINNPGGKLGDEKYQWIREGQTLANLKVEEIKPKEIILNDGSEKYQILLSEKKRRGGQPKKDKKSGPTVVSGGSLSEKTKPRSTPSQSTSKTSGDGSKKELTSGDSGSEESEEKYETIHTPFGKIKRKKK